MLKGARFFSGALTGGVQNVGRANQRLAVAAQQTRAHWNSAGGNSQSGKSKWKLFSIPLAITLSATGLIAASTYRWAEKEIDSQVHPMLDGMRLRIYNIYQASRVLDHGLIETNWLTNRSHEEQANLYRCAQTEIVLLCNTGGGRFVTTPEVWDAVCSKAKEGVSVKFLFTDPETTSPLMSEVKKNNARALMKMIEEFNSANESQIEVGLLNEPPPFNADLIDANITEEYAEERGREGKNQVNSLLVLMPKTEQTDPSRILYFKYMDIGEDFSFSAGKVCSASPYYYFRGQISDIWSSSHAPQLTGSAMSPGLGSES